MNEDTQIIQELSKEISAEIDLDGGRYPQKNLNYCYIVEGKVIKLQLVGNNFSKLPHIISNLRDLEILVLRKNNLRLIPDWIDELEKLTHCIITHDRIKGSSGTFQDMENLDVIDLSNNVIEELSNHIITNLPNLTGIILANNQISEIYPEALKNLGNLSGLVLSNNNLSNLPDIGDLLNLQGLSLDSNKLRTLPKSMKELANLSHIDIHSNQLKSLPESMKYLKQLKSINLSNNRLTKFPTWANADNWPEIQEVNLENNSIESFPTDLLTCPNLKSLNLSNNQIDSPHSIPHKVNPTLTYLDLAENPIFQDPYILQTIEEGRYGSPLYVKLEVIHRYKTILKEIKCSLEKNEIPCAPTHNGTYNREYFGAEPFEVLIDELWHFDLLEQCLHICEKIETNKSRMLSQLVLEKWPKYKLGKTGFNLQL